MRVAVAEDSLVYRNGLVRLLEAAGATVVHEAATGEELLAQLAQLDGSSTGAEPPDVVMLDIRMNGRDDDGLLAAEAIGTAHPRLGILLLSAHADPAYAQRLFANGSAGRGYLLKDSLDSVAELTEALGRIHQGGTYTDPRVIDQLIRDRAGNRPVDLLTPREQAVLSLLVSGASNAAIAHGTRTSTKAVESAISALYTKLGIPDAPDYNRRVLVVLRCLNDG